MATHWQPNFATLANKHLLASEHLLSSAPTITSEYATRYAKGAAASWRHSVWPVIACAADNYLLHHLSHCVSKVLLCVNKNYYRQARESSCAMSQSENLTYKTPIYQMICTTFASGHG